MHTHTQVDGLRERTVIFFIANAIAMSARKDDTRFHKSANKTDVYILNYDRALVFSFF